MFEFIPQLCRGLKILINGIPDPDIYHLQFDLNVPR